MATATLPSLDVVIALLARYPAASAIEDDINRPTLVESFCKLNPRYDFNCMNDFSLLKLFKKEDYSLKIRDSLIRSDKWKYYEVCFASINKHCLDCICQVKLETMQVLHRPPVLD